MAIRKIARLGEPVLRRAAQPVAPEQIGSAELQRLIDDMVQTMRDANGAGLAAPQVYESLQLCVIEVSANPRYPAFPEIPLTVLINPVLTPRTAQPPLPEETIHMYEGCLSVPGLRGRVSRPRLVHLSALGADGSRVEAEVSGIHAAILQHEVDHLHGTLFVDRADPSTLSFDKEYERHVPHVERIIDGGSLSR